MRKKITVRNPGGEKRASPQDLRGQFFRAVFFRVMHNGQSERGTSLDYWKQRHANALSTYTLKSPRTILPAELIISQAVHHVPELPVGPGGPGSPLGPAKKMKNY